MVIVVPVYEAEGNTQLLPLIFLVSKGQELVLDLRTLVLYQVNQNDLFLGLILITLVCFVVVMASHLEVPESVKI
jgi:hypothetical protein